MREVNVTIGRKHIDRIAVHISQLIHRTAKMEPYQLPDTLERVRALKKSLDHLEELLTAHVTCVAQVDVPLLGRFYACLVTKCNRQGIEIDKLRKDEPEIADRYAKNSPYLRVEIARCMDTPIANYRDTKVLN